MKNYSILVLGLMMANTYTVDRGSVTASIAFYGTPMIASRTTVVLRPKMTLLDVQEELRKQARNGSLKDSGGNTLRNGALYRGQLRGKLAFATPVDGDDQGRIKWTLAEEFGSLTRAADRLGEDYCFIGDSESLEREPF